jgi:hypothetical protein
MTWEISLIPSSSRWENSLVSLFGTTDINKITDFSSLAVIVFYLNVLP